jgi:two-component system OmpR family sensor kinase
MRRRRRALASIRWRFALGVSVVLIAAVGVAFVIVYRDTGDRLSAQIERDLRSDTAQLAQSLHAVPGGSAATVKAAALRYVSAQPFRSISTLLFVLVPGAEPVSNHPEIFFGSRPDEGETVAEQAEENALAQRVRQPSVGLATRRVVDVGRVRFLERPLSVGGRRVIVGAGEPLVSVTRAQREVVHSFLFAGAFVVLAVLIASYLVSTRVTAPLRRMARVAARVDAGDLEPRMDVAEGRRDEVGVLATAFNHMLQRLEEGFRGQREFIADASHELRTPLTVIQGQFEVLASHANPDGAEVRRVERLVNAEIRRMRRLVDDLLLLAQSERIDFLKTDSVDLERFITQLWDGATLMAERRFECGSIPQGRLRADPDRLAQAVRNLINNAIDHTRPGDGLIRLEVTRAPPEGIRIAIIDDGPGIPPEEIDRIFERFHRTSASRSAANGGAGLGLAIVRAIAEAHGGTAIAANSPDGSGARFEIQLPGFEAEGRPSAISAEVSAAHDRSITLVRSRHPGER